MSGDRFGSTTDLITNLTTFPQVHLRKDVREMFRMGPSPSRHLQSFLHEATHHWCFHSSVGAALSTLSLHVRIDAARLLGERTVDRQAILERLTRTLTRQRVAQACLGPFVEGLALFAEFDATPRIRTRVRSSVMDKVAFFFGMPVPGTITEDTLALLGDSADGIPDMQREIDKWLLLVLGRSRTAASCVDRKANILVHPFDVRSGYLPGYLFVKSIWDGLARRVPRFRNETDLFFTYIRHHIFENPTLVRVLLNTDEDQPINIAATVALAVDERFEALLDVRPEDLELFEQAIDSENFSWDDPRFLRSIQVESEDRRLAMNELRELNKHWNSDSSGSDNHGVAWNMAWRAAMAGRSFISMGAMSVTFAVHGDRLTCPDDPELQSSVGQASSLWRDEHGLKAGTAELLFFHSERGLPTRMLAFTVDDRMSGIATIPTSEPSEMRTWLKLLVERSQAGGLIIRHAGALLDMVRPVLVQETAFGEVENALPSKVGAMYMPWSLVQVSDARRRAELAAAMRQKGLRGLLDSTLEVRALAALSLSVMRNPHIEFVKADLRSKGFDPDRVVQRLTSLYELEGFPWVELVDGYVLAVV